MEKIGATWAANFGQLQTWRGTMSYDQEQIAPREIVSHIDPEYSESEVIRETDGTGPFVIDVAGRRLYSYCAGRESYFAPSDRRPVGESSYPGAFGVILRPDSEQSLWYEPETKANLLLRRGDGSLRLSPGVGAFRIDAYRLGEGQGFGGRTLDPRRYFTLFSVPVDQVMRELARQLEGDGEFSRLATLEIDAASKPDYVRMTIETDERRAWYVLSISAAGNLVESKVEHLRPATESSAIEFEEQRAEFENINGIQLPVRYSFSQVDGLGRVRFARTSRITTKSVNDAVGDDQFTWAAFSPAPGQVVYDAISKRRLRFDEKLNLVEVSGRELSSEGRPADQRYIPHEKSRPSSAVARWLVVGNLLGIIAVAVWLVRERRRAAGTSER